MGCQDSFSKASLATIFALFIVVVANFCSWISFTTTSWYVTDLPLDANGDIHQGLWRQCRSKLITACVTLDGYGDPTFAAVQAFAIIGFVGVNVSNFMIILYIFWDSLRKSPELGFISALILVLAGLCWTVAVVVFALGYEVSGADLHYSFGFGVCAAIFGTLTGLLMFYAHRSEQSTGPVRHASLKA